MVAEGLPAPTFSLKDQDGNTHSLSDYKGKKVLLYFYPKDDTPGCTTEACNFRDSYKDFQSKGLAILGVSADSVEKHKKFAEKYNLPFPLLSDEDHKVCEAYGVWGEKNFMGRKYMGISRSSFLIDEEGNIGKVYEKVKPKEHAEKVIGDLS
ncbi:thioredoxin-dependent thiol peroxidase [Candidatus Kaiserbacteria bacterium]|nr:thioredoxin-dependent thiol peroxidase [Candidatus Kaiserbacteria bacterium]